MLFMNRKVNGSGKKGMINYVDLRVFDKHAKDAERVLNQLMKHGRTKSSNTELPRIFGMKAKDLIDSGMLDFATTQRRSGPKKTLFQIDNDVHTEPIGVRWYFKRLKL